MDSLDFYFTKYLLFWVKVKCPFNFFADEGPAEEVFERTESVINDLIICKTLTILVQRTSDSDN